MEYPSYKKIPSLKCLFNKYGWFFVKKFNIKQCNEYHALWLRRKDYQGTDSLRYSVELSNKHTLVIGYIKPPWEGEKILGWSIAVTSTKPTVSPKEAKSIENQLRVHIETRIIPHAGRSVYKDTPSKFGVLKIHTENPDGTFSNIPVLCQERKSDNTECKGIFIPNPLGEYICQNCGIIHPFRSLDSCEEDIEEEEVEETEESGYHDVMMQSSNGLYPIHTLNAYGNGLELPRDRFTEVRKEFTELGRYTSIEDRNNIELIDIVYSSHRSHKDMGSAEAESYMSTFTPEDYLLHWKTSLEVAPQYEIDAKHAAMERKAKHEKHKKEGRKRWVQSNQFHLYRGKWRALQARARQSRIVSLVKAGIQDKIVLRDMIKDDTGRSNFYRDLDLLCSTGRLQIIKNDEGKKIVSLVVPPKPARSFPVQIEKVPIKYDPRDVRPSIMVYHRTLKCSKCGEPFEITSMNEFKNVACSKCVKAIEDES